MSNGFCEKIQTLILRVIKLETSWRKVLLIIYVNSCLQVLHSTFELDKCNQRKIAENCGNINIIFITYISSRFIKWRTMSRGMTEYEIDNVTWKFFFHLIAYIAFIEIVDSPCISSILWKYLYFVFLRNE